MMAYPCQTLTRTALGQIVRRPMGHPITAGCDTACNRTVVVSVPNHCPGVLGYYFKPEERVPLLALQHHFQQHLVSHPETDQYQPCLASEASQQVVCRVVCC